MASNRNAPARPAPAQASVQVEKDCECRDRSAPKEPLPPQAGRTGTQGKRAERPSDGAQQPQDKEDGRGAKAPSAHPQPHSDERSSK